MIPLLSAGQSINPPGIAWKRSDWFPEHPLNGPQGRDASGEDWWYSHANSVSPDGFICAGYSTLVNYDSLSIALLLEGLENGMDSSFIVRQLVQAFFTLDNTDSTQSWLSFLTHEADEEFVSLFEILTALQQANHSLGELTGNDTLNLLRNLTSGTGYESVAAKTLLNYYYDEPYNYVPEFYEPESPRKSEAILHEMEPGILVSPNPSADNFRIRLTNGDIAQVGQLYLTNTSGIITEPGLIQIKDGSADVSATLLKNGIYFIHVRMQESNESYVAKLVVIK